ncbi:restriction endonuclease [Gordonia phthalatica]|uniref:restriction endonuclease n=1 Tax=Gordonia phthalatica TaxID=1136941 RepID=UPI0012FF3901|nr:restriction endonuclease [Gordonia phthalatica]
MTVALRASLAAKPPPQLPIEGEYLISLPWDDCEPAGVSGARPTGSVGLIHLESHFTDEKAGRLRAETYQRLRRHWQFINELKLFEIQNQRRYGVNVYASRRKPAFRQAASLYHPDTVTRSLEHDGSGTEPGIKDPDGNWDLRPHAARIVQVDVGTLRSWHAVLETDDVPINQTRMVYAVNRSSAEVLAKLAAASRIETLGLQFSLGWMENNATKAKGYYSARWGRAESWGEVILQGPHIYVGNPFYKSPNETMRNHLDWTAVDLESLPADAVPITSYKPMGDRDRYDAAYTHWQTEPEDSVSARQFYRVAWRNMAANTGERTLIPAIIPPGTAHVHGLFSIGYNWEPTDVALVAGCMSSLLLDFAIRVAPKSTIPAATVGRLPLADGGDRGSPLAKSIMLRSLRLNCLTEKYAPLWAACFSSEFADDAWTCDERRVVGGSLGVAEDRWNTSTPLRRASDRRQALLEIDALVAIALGITADELASVYRTQFPVLFGYDRKRDWYDARGRLLQGVTVQSGHQESIGKSLKLPSPVNYDREYDLRRAHQVFLSRITNSA